MHTINVPVSVLNLAPIRAGEDAKQAIDNVVDLAQYVEELGYNRFWIAEHHNTPNLASSATVILINQVLNHTQSIQVGAGGIMLPNHAPLVVAEQFGTMETLFPNRLNLGLGRAPGTDMLTASALRRSQHDSVHTFPDDVASLLQYFGPEETQGYVRAYPGADTNVPVFILGSSTDSAHLAARMGLPYVFASHFAPEQMREAIAIYRNLFTPSKYLAEPYVMVGMNVIAAETDEEAEFLSSSMHLMFLSIIRNARQPMQPPTDQLDAIWSPQEKLMAMSRTTTSLIGSKATIKRQFEAFQQEYQVDEIIAVSYIYDQDKLKRSYQILKEITS
ncbi:LLM class flavin-dependent oxidoreductase [Macrococcus bovicus]|uniref:LLM class flavin-dependent oxidoreductase n=1 Tax=Macrococcus bovicus TaxID=69968 RepID=A0A4R6C2Q5_9STAP|nr:LLM class flavin-dependent oxidoreductase [Macrococcus bovicus]TDM15640.1 LLM class flavin-dependent oxidoreductase [Macrococcus bovicus]WJP97006.1 LLM class flavin-dependent oxidoreductase [Macrococcus bovicus]